MKRLAWIVLIVGAVIAGGCDRAERAKQHQIEEADREWGNAVNALAKGHDAITNWVEQIPGRAFTIDVSRALIQTNGRPVLFEMFLLDVKAVEQGDTYIAQFGQNYVFFQLSLVLKCSKEQAKKLLQTQETVSTPCAIVARISEVLRPRFRVKTTIDKDEDGEIVLLNLDSPDVFFANGVCVDFLRKVEIK